MNRRSFFKRMFCGIAAAIGLPLAAKAKTLPVGEVTSEELNKIRSALAAGTPIEDGAYRRKSQLQDGQCSECKGFFHNLFIPIGGDRNKPMCFCCTRKYLN